MRHLILAITAMMLAGCHSASDAPQTLSSLQEPGSTSVGVLGRQFAGPRTTLESMPTAAILIPYVGDTTGDPRPAAGQTPDPNRPPPEQMAGLRARAIRVCEAFKGIQPAPVAFGSLVARNVILTRWVLTEQGERGMTAQRANDCNYLVDNYDARRARAKIAESRPAAPASARSRTAQPASSPMTGQGPFLVQFIGNRVVGIDGTSQADGNMEPFMSRWQTAVSEQERQATEAAESGRSSTINWMACANIAGRVTVAVVGFFWPAGSGLITTIDNILKDASAGSSCWGTGTSSGTGSTPART